MAAHQYGLGRGLSSLIPKDESGKKRDMSALLAREGILSGANAKDGALEVSVDSIIPNPHQPRSRFDEDKLSELAESIREHGVLQPLIVTKKPGGFELVAGERRLRASKIAGLPSVPVVIRSFEGRQKLELAIIENIQRHDLNSLEEARAYQKLADEFGLSQEEIAKKMGRKRSSIANTLRLLSLPVEIQRALEEEKISEGHAKVILSLTNAEKQRALYEEILRKRLTVRQAESLAKRDVSSRSYERTGIPSEAQNPQLKVLESELAEKIGTRVSIKKQGSGARITIDFYSQKELQEFIQQQTSRNL